MKTSIETVAPSPPLQVTIADLEPMQAGVDDDGRVWLVTALDEGRRCVVCINTARSFTADSEGSDGIRKVRPLTKLTLVLDEF